MPEETALRRTPLHDRHLAAGARIVPFAGWEMPVQYEGIIPEHLAVRSHAGVFDVSHMGQLELRGPGTMRFAQAALSNDLDRIGPGHAQYTLLLEDTGCPVDDLIVYRFADDHLLLVVNASRTDADHAWLAEGLPSDVTMDDRSAELAMLALQGPAALTLVELPGAAAVRLHPRRGMRRARDRCPHRIHRRARRRADLRAGARGAALGRACWPPARRRAAWARGTRCGSRSATRCTATTCRWSGRRWRRASAGSARWTPRTSSAPPRCAASASAAATTGWSPSA